MNVLKKLGYLPLPNKKGAARHFKNDDRDPPIVTFHEPHGSREIRHGTLRENVRKLKLTKDEFLDLLEGK